LLAERKPDDEPALERLDASADAANRPSLSSPVRSQSQVERAGEPGGATARERERRRWPPRQRQAGEVPLEKVLDVGPSGRLDARRAAGASLARGSGRRVGDVLVDGLDVPRWYLSRSRVPCARSEQRYAGAAIPTYQI
jgi:hypothetical protein